MSKRVIAWQRAGDVGSWQRQGGDMRTIATWVMVALLALGTAAPARARPAFIGTPDASEVRGRPPAEIVPLLSLVVTLPEGSPPTVTLARYELVPGAEVAVAPVRGPAVYLATVDGIEVRTDQASP